eukprot:11445749-Heterocapsa_arctica.AAC.1
METVVQPARVPDHPRDKVALRGDEDVVLDLDGSHESADEPCHGLVHALDGVNALMASHRRLLQLRAAPLLAAECGHTPRHSVHRALLVRADDHVARDAHLLDGAHDDHDRELVVRPRSASRRRGPP